MQYRHKPGAVGDYQRGLRQALRLMKEIPSEVFKWIGAIAAIATLHVVDARTDSAWLQVLAYALSFLLVGWMQWFFYRIGLTRHPEERQPDGSLVISFRVWRLLLGGALCVLSYLFAFYLPLMIAGSNLLRM